VPEHCAFLFGIIEFAAKLMGANGGGQKLDYSVQRSAAKRMYTNRGAVGGGGYIGGGWGGRPASGACGGLYFFDKTWEAVRAVNAGLHPLRGCGNTTALPLGIGFAPLLALLTLGPAS
jgi:hypothetical protein